MFLKVNIPKEKYYSTEFDKNLQVLLNNLEFNTIHATEAKGISKTTSHKLTVLPNLKNFREIF